MERRCFAPILKVKSSIEYTPREKNVYSTFATRPDSHGTTLDFSCVGQLGDPSSFCRAAQWPSLIFNIGSVIRRAASQQRSASSCKLIDNECSSDTQECTDYARN
jgi:hypothetical protein